MTSNVTKLLEFMSKIGQLKRVKRTGWVLRRVQEPESVSDHMYRMAIMSMLLTPEKYPNIDKERCIKLALVHDMAECIVGDIAPADGISKEEKHKREQNAMSELGDLIADEETQKEIHGLWEEYEHQSSEEAKVVKDLDRFEMVLQAHEYEVQENRPGELQDFFDSTKGKFQHPGVQEWVDQLYSNRDKHLQTKSSHNPKKQKLDRTSNTQATDSESS
ncbi:unnamed protein product [Owenia fusiformis]|uniref:5'-deoxynucleotidase HDDC2 n=1 Tax=Owenia fusiformis TaxID=6347 RepID=A0A8J1XRA9_OWEFU|nr:unnamed protein product [Owenia fusiformis]